MERDKINADRDSNNLLQQSKADAKRIQERFIALVSPIISELETYKINNSRAPWDMISGSHGELLKTGADLIVTLSGDGRQRFSKALNECAGKNKNTLPRESGTVDYSISAASLLEILKRMRDAVPKEP